MPAYSLRITPRGGGSDQGALLAGLADQGFQVLALSRPGYLDTPLDSGRSFAEQGDLGVCFVVARRQREVGGAAGVDVAVTRGVPSAAT